MRAANRWSLLTVARLIVECSLPMLFLCGPVFADEASELMQNVKWSIAHEGCRVFDSNNGIGDIHRIRQCIWDTQAANQRARELLHRVDDTTLRQVVQDATIEIPSEFHLVDNFKWVMYHEGQRNRMRRMLEGGNFKGIRDLYFEKQRNDLNARHVLAGVSDQTIADLIRNN